MKSYLYIFLIIVLTLNACQRSVESDEYKISLFNSELTTDQATTINSCVDFLNNWYIELTGDIKINGDTLKKILRYYAEANNLSLIPGDFAECNKFNVLKINLEKCGLANELFEPINISATPMNKQTSNGCLVKALELYAKTMKDTTLQKYIVSKSTANIYSPDIICLSYANLNKDQLEDPIYQRMLFIDLFLIRYYQYCKQ